VADFTKEISHEATAVGFEDEGQDCVGGIVGQAGQRDMQSVPDQPESVLPVAGQVIGGGAPGLRREDEGGGSVAVEGQESALAADHRGLDGGVKKKRGRAVIRRASKSVAARNEAVLERLRDLKGDHPFWGYRHCWAHLRYVDKLDVNKKRVYRLLREHGLLATQTKHAVPRTSTRSKPRPDRPNQWWGIDMTKALTESGWAYVVLVLDWYTKKVVGHHCGRTATSGEWLTALDRGLESSVSRRGQGSPVPRSEPTAPDVGQRFSANFGAIHAGLFGAGGSPGVYLLQQSQGER